MDNLENRIEYLELMVENLLEDVGRISLEFAAFATALVLDNDITLPSLAELSN